MLPDDMLAAMDERVAKEVPSPDGFWRGATCDTYQRIGRHFLDGGYQPDEIIRILRELYWAAAEEFGG